MVLREALLAEFDHEMAVTRSLLERVPDASLAWRPHDKSMTLGGLATHLCRVLRWGTAILDRSGYDLVADHRDSPADLPNRREILEAFDRNADDVRKTMIERLDAELVAPWSLTSGGHLILSVPRLGALRRFMLNHLIHHRGQLTVYLRLQNVPLPPMYGPTADEGM